MNNRNIIGNKLGITQEDLAARLDILDINIFIQIISKSESNSREIVDYEVKTLAKALKVSINDLFEE